MITGMWKSRQEKFLDAWKWEPQVIYVRTSWEIDYSKYRIEYAPSYMQFMKPSDRLEYVMQIIGLIKGRKFI